MDSCKVIQEERMDDKTLIVIDEWKERMRLCSVMDDASNFDKEISRYPEIN